MAMVLVIHWWPILSGELIIDGTRSGEFQMVQSSKDDSR